MTDKPPFLPPELPDALSQPAPEPEDKHDRPYTPAEGLDPEAPYGYTIDRKTGEKRPRKRAGRGVRVVKTEEPPAPPQTEREPDRIPGRVKPESKTRGARRAGAPKPELEPLPVFRAGPIAKSVNKLYLRAGKLVRAMDPDIGTAIIAMTKAETEDDVTVGEAWEEVAKNNPRIRRALLKLISGGAWSQLFMAHAPLLLAVLLKERIARRLPLMGMLASLLDDSDAGPGPAAASHAAAGPFTDLTPEDIQEAMNAFNQFMPGMYMPGMNAGRSPMPSRTAVAEDFLDGADAAA